MSSIVMVCKGIPLLFILTAHMDCKDVRATPEPQKVFCSGPSVPVITVAENRALPARVRNFMAKSKRNRIDNHCPETVK